MFDRACVTLKPLDPDRAAARYGATHILSLNMAAGTWLESFVPLLVTLDGEPRSFRDEPAGAYEQIHYWNAATMTLVPAIAIHSHGGLVASLANGVLTPLEDNEERFLVEPLKVEIREGVL